MSIPLREDLSAKQMRRVIYSLAIPIVGTNLLLRGVGIVDTAMVGHISAQAQAAVGMSQWIIGFMMAIVQGMNVGGVISVARCRSSTRFRSPRSCSWAEGSTWHMAHGDGNQVSEHEQQQARANPACYSAK